MTQFEILDEVLASCNGIISLKQAASLRISKKVFYDFAPERDLRKVGPGIYASKDAWEDRMYILHLRFKDLVFSHESALLFHDLTDREPFQYDVTLPTGYNPGQLKEEGARPFTIKKELHKVGLTKAKTIFGHEVPCYDMERTIVDIVRSRSKIEAQVYYGALKEYARRKDKDLYLLSRYSNMFGVEKIIGEYFSVLL